MANHPDSLGKCFELGNDGEPESTHLSLQWSVIRGWPSVLMAALEAAGALPWIFLYPVTLNKLLLVPLCSVLSLALLLDPPSPCSHAFMPLVNVPMKIPGQLLCF